jgi:predicted SnoaL-like aldol condensation-catalyzing enzyme
MDMSRTLVLKTIRHCRIALGMMVGLGAVLSSGSPAAAHETAAEVANTKVVVDFYAALNAADADGAFKQRIQSIVETYIAPDYVQHSDMFASLPGPGSARDKLIRMFQTRPPMPPMGTPKTVAVMAQGDRVMMLTSRDMPDPATGHAKTVYIFNMFRLKDGRLAEHWDITPMPPAPAGPGAPMDTGPMPPATP